jgi:hypothetical protein
MFLMDDATFKRVQQELDGEIDRLGPNPQVGIRVGFTLYDELRRRKLLADKIADFNHWKFRFPSYRDLFVSEGREVTHDRYKVGSATP